MNFLLLLILCLFCNCTTLNNITPKVMQPVSHTFDNNYDEVWSATESVLEDYTIEHKNKNTRTLHTKLTAYNSKFTIPFKVNHPKDPKVYKIKIKFIKYTDRPIVTVSVLKQLFIKERFLSEKTRIPSIGLEEKMILYRILRELKIKSTIRQYENKL